MAKERFNYEKNIINYFQLFANKEHDMCFSRPLYIPDTDASEKIFQSIKDDVLWEKWNDSSGKNEPPPDYYNNELKVMMEVMRVDDNAYIDEITGKIINPIRARESKVICEIKESGILDKISSDAEIAIVANSGLSSDEDHNYIYYRDNFIRIVENHKKKIPGYLQNHPGFKIIFFVFDESSMYIKLENGYSKRMFTGKGSIASGQLHLWWRDETFVNVIVDSEIDYFIWVTPYKQLILEKGMEAKLPGVCIFDVKNMNIVTETYNERRMVSTEE